MTDLDRGGRRQSDQTGEKKLLFLFLKIPIDAGKKW